MTQNVPTGAAYTVVPLKPRPRPKIRRRKSIGYVDVPTLLIIIALYGILGFLLGGGIR